MKARHYYEQAAALGHVEALTRLGDMYIMGVAVKLDATQARQYYEQAAALGDRYAQLQLGRFYFGGRPPNIKQDFLKARHYFEQAAAQNLSQAQGFLGFIYHHGLGVDIDIDKAIEWYATSCDYGRRESCDNYEGLLENKQAHDIDSTERIPVPVDGSQPE